MNNRRLSFLLMICLIFVLTAVPSLLPAQDKSFGEKNYRIYSVKQAKIINIQAIIDDFKDYDVILFGEEHNDAVAHYLEALLVEKLYDKYGNSLALSLEMFDRDVQVVLDEYLSDCITERYFTKDARVWNNYEDYRPMIEFAKEKKINIIAANAPFRYANMARRKGQETLSSLTETAKSFFAPLPYDTATGAHYEKLMKVMNTMPMPVIDDTAAGINTLKMPLMPAQSMPSLNINQGQSLWNATMAFSIHAYLSEHRNSKVLHINGKFHSDEYFGVPQQLRKYNPQIRYLVISAFPDSIYPKMDFTEYKNLGDYIIITASGYSVDLEK
ncbi:hypothetical protein A2Y85_07680 [candidate division WOR-3 bacterium RBG_13_43_14]|uniref:Haem-binding uptake Tiki superfamily ChaN domain-containing protein n=1 Tax=candidate division WOR-3 bacterium RBG_13_43_14 TaxID=1802590 RepID=A0A1F4UGP6_UNCW3|nr:MAG: hypothetical protein A2Y85_07680 [candidate division WOR-3 bacterium RBG_13_43_14]